MILSKNNQANFAIFSGAMMFGGVGFTFLGIIVYGMGAGVRELEWWMLLLSIGLVVMYAVSDGLIDSGRKMRKTL